jgi:hypothetical protein
MRVLECPDNQCRVWLHRRGFKDDPFASCDADWERPHLPYFYVDFPRLQELLTGGTYGPTIVFSDQGQGKTAACEKLAYESVYGQLRRRVLVVRYNHFEPLLEQLSGDLEAIETRHHIYAIVRCILRALAEDTPHTYFESLMPADRHLLKGYVIRYSDPLSHTRLDRVLADISTPFPVDWDTSYHDILETLVSLIVRLGYQSLYVLVDDVHKTSAGGEAILPLLLSLLHDLRTMVMPHLEFKFFLPARLRKDLLRSPFVRPERIMSAEPPYSEYDPETFHVDWSPEMLKQMVDLRLSYYSGGRINQLEELFVVEDRHSVEDRLVWHNVGSPRKLLQICGALVHNAAARAEDALINSTDLLKTLFDLREEVQ